MPSKALKTLLSIDTLDTTLQASLYHNGVIYQRVAQSKKHANHITSLVSALCDESAIDPSSISHLAVNSGPGPFTGLRVGIAYVRALAHARSLPVVALTHSAILAYACVRFTAHPASPGPIIATLIDARLGQAYYASYRQHATGLMTPLSEDRIVDLASFPAVESTSNMIKTGPFWGTYQHVPEPWRDVPAQSSPVDHPCPNTISLPFSAFLTHHAMTRATAMIFITELLLQRQALVTLHAKDLRPNYVRHDVAKKSADQVKRDQRNDHEK